MLLTSTRDVARRWKEYLEDLLNPKNMCSTEDTESVDSLITRAEVARVVEKLHGGRAPGVDEIRPEFLKALEVVGLSWLTRLCNIAWTLGTAPLDWQTRVVGTEESHSSASLVRSIQGCLRGESNQLSKLRSRRNNVGSVLAVKNWISSIII